MDDTVRARIRVSGRVQGVFFRQTTAEEANRLGVGGWVRNLPDGDVEAVIEGPSRDVDRLIAWCHHGPPAARVDDVSISWETATGQFARFNIQY
ncbi:MAG: acylphosphatase [Deltaproteobacteria bacterium]|nr:acylphosphatase [Candidatus Zymogenaceae bacterium]